MLRQGVRALPPSHGDDCAGVSFPDLGFGVGAGRTRRQAH